MNESPLTPERVEQVLGKLPALRIGVFGDLFLDRYLDIDAALTEPSLETGLEAYQVVGVRSYPGAAGTVVNNLSALGVGAIVPIAVIGDDGEGCELWQALEGLPGVQLAHIVRGRFGDFRGVTLKPNDAECHRAVPEETSAEDGALRLARRCGRAVLRTLGSRGTVVAEPPSVQGIRAYPVTGPIDPVGAGDSTSAAI